MKGNQARYTSEDIASNKMISKLLQVDSLEHLSRDKLPTQHDVTMVCTPKWQWNWKPKRYMLLLHNALVHEIHRHYYNWSERRLPPLSFEGFLYFFLLELIFSYKNIKLISAHPHSRKIYMWILHHL